MNRLVCGVVIVIAASPIAAARHHKKNWQTGHVMSTREASAYLGTMPVTLAPGTVSATTNVWGNTANTSATYRPPTTMYVPLRKSWKTFALKTATRIYFCEDGGLTKRGWPGRPALLVIGSNVQFYTHSGWTGDWLFVKDERGKIHRTRLVRERLLNPAPMPKATAASSTSAKAANKALTASERPAAR